MKTLIVSLLTIATTSMAFERTTIPNQLKPFSTDGCSLVPDGPWLNCCIVHDHAYWKGGTKEERKIADAELKKCVAEESGNIMGILFQFGVRLGGSPNTKLGWRWGYGWTFNRPYSPLSESELAQVNSYNFDVNSFISSTPTLTSGGKPGTYPSDTGNYCIDEIKEFLYQQGLGETPITVTKLKRQGLAEYAVKQDGQNKKIFQFRVPERLCTQPHYSNEPTRFLRSVKTVSAKT